MLWNIIYFCLRVPMTCSTWILTFAILRVFSTLTGSSWFLPLVNAGTLRSAWWNHTCSCTVKPLSARTRSPGTNLFKNPQFSVRNLFEVRPPKPRLQMKINIYSTLWGNPDPHFDCVVVFVVGKYLCPCQKIRWSVNEYLKTVDDHTCFETEWINETSWHCPLQLFPIWPDN